MSIELKDRLSALREEISRGIARDEAELAIEPESRGEDTTASQHPADVASDLFVRESLLTNEQQLRGDLSAIEDALRRLDRGIYGVCVDCGHAIAAARLAVLPQADRCVECQRRTERLAIRR